MKYKTLITKSMLYLAKDPRVMFIGYNTKCGHRMYGTLNDVPKSKCLETPVAENLMMGLAMGMSLEGYRPVVCFERMDFMLVAADSIINQLSALPELSGNQFTFPVIIRAIVGNAAPLNPGIQHTGDYSALFSEKTNISVKTFFDRSLIKPAYKKALASDDPTILIEYKDRY